MGSNGKIDLSGSQLGDDAALDFGRCGACQEGAADVQLFQQGGKAPVMLLCQQLGGSHQRRLTAIFYAEIHAGGGHHGFAGADIPLTQPVHGLPTAHIPDGLLYAAPLGVRQREGKRAVKRSHIHILKGDYIHRFPPGAQQLQSDGEEKQLLKSQTPPGNVQRLRGFRKVDVLVGVVHPAELVGLPHAVRQAVRQNVGAGVQPLPDGP